MIKYINCNPTISELYESRFSDNAEKQFRVSVKFAESPAPFSVILTGGDKEPDCKISSFTENIYFRTRNGENYLRYSSIKSMEKAIKNISKKYGYTLEHLIVEKGEPDRI